MSQRWEEYVYKVLHNPHILGYVRNERRNGIILCNPKEVPSDTSTDQFTNSCFFKVENYGKYLPYKVFRQVFM